MFWTSKRLTDIQDETHLVHPFIRVYLSQLLERQNKLKSTGGIRAKRREGVMHAENDCCSKQEAKADQCRCDRVQKGESERKERERERERGRKKSKKHQASSINLFLLSFHFALCTVASVAVRRFVCLSALQHSHSSSVVE